LKTVPWAMPAQLEGFINEISLYIFAIALAFPNYWIGLKYMYGVATLLTAIANIYPVTYYDKLTTKVTTMYQTALLVSLSGMTGSYFGTVTNTQY
jgi:hypothetical protein